MSGAEQDLTPELEKSVVSSGGLKLVPGLASMRVGDLANSLTSGGSANWAPVGWAVRYRGGDPAAVDQWRRFFAASRETFMGTEMFSLIYWWGHVLPVAAVDQSAGPEDVRDAAHDWLRYYFGAAELMRDAEYSGQILMVGMRSGGHDPDAAGTWLGWLRALARGEDLGPWEAKGKQLHLGMRQGWEYGTALALRGVISAAATSTDKLPKYGLMTPVHIQRTEEGLAVWAEFNVNGNTTPLMAAVSVRGEISYLPAGGGRRIRGQSESATCADDGRLLLYKSNLQGEQSAALPGGQVLQEVTLGAAEA